MNTTEGKPDPSVSDNGGSGQGNKSKDAGSEKSGSQATDSKELPPEFQTKLGCKTEGEAILKLVEQNAAFKAQNEAAQAEIGRQSADIGDLRQMQQQERPEFTDEQRQNVTQRFESGDGLGVIAEITSAQAAADQNIERRRLDAYMQARTSDPQFDNIDRSEFNWQALKQGINPALIVDPNKAKEVMRKIVKSRPVDVDAIRADERQKTIKLLKSDEDQLKAAGLTLASNTGAGKLDTEDLTKPLTPEESEERDTLALAITTGRLTSNAIINQLGEAKARRYGMLE